MFLVDGRGVLGNMQPLIRQCSKEKENYGNKSRNQWFRPDRSDRQTIDAIHPFLYFSIDNVRVSSYFNFTEYLLDLSKD